MDAVAGARLRAIEERQRGAGLGLLVAGDAEAVLGNPALERVLDLFAVLIVGPHRQLEEALLASHLPDLQRERTAELALVLLPDAGLDRAEAAQGIEVEPGPGLSEEAALRAGQASVQRHLAPHDLVELLGLDLGGER